MRYAAKYTELYEKNFAKLHSNEKSAVKSAVNMMLETAPRFTIGLGIDKIETAKHIKPTVWEARASKELRLSWQYKSEQDYRYILFRNVGHHDDLLKKP